MQTQKSIVYIDGYNFYRALKKHSGLPIHLGWCDFGKLARLFMLDGPQELVAIKYFTARVGRLGEKGGELGGEESRQQRWLEAAQTIDGLQIIEGSFRGDANASRPSQARKEKQTDINIAIHMVRDALKGLCDHEILISADHDFIPALQMVRESGKTLELWLPPGHEIGALALLEASGIRVRRITERMLNDSLLPDPIHHQGRLIEAPKAWKRRTLSR